MRAVVQRVRSASVTIGGVVTASIGAGLLVLAGVAVTDTENDARALAAKVATLRIFDDASGAMNLDVQAIGGAILLVSQFTLQADTRRGRRPSFVQAAPRPLAEPLYEAVAAALRATGIPVQTGVFGADMAVALVNDGPVTILLDTAGN